MTEIPVELEDAILEMKRERNAIILAHYYQEDEIQDLADVVGDSLALARAAQQTDCDVIAFCGVNFMAETAAILNPERIVVVPDIEAGCSLADGCPADEFQAFIDQHPGAKVLTYINTSAEVKALSDLICTSSNAVAMVESFGDEPLIFAPDRHLARWVSKQTGRDDLIVWPGACVVHEQFSAKELAKLKIRYPEADVLAHPECEQTVLDQADFIASTSGIIQRAIDHPDRPSIVATEDGVFHAIRAKAPGKVLIQAPGMDESMRLNTLEKLYVSLRDLQPRVTVSPELSKRALEPIERMLALS
jgi:quinolinate synthase